MLLDNKGLRSPLFQFLHVKIISPNKLVSEKHRPFIRKDFYFSIVQQYLITCKSSVQI